MNATSSLRAAVELAKFKNIIRVTDVAVGRNVDYTNLQDLPESAVTKHAHLYFSSIGSTWGDLKLHLPRMTGVRSLSISRANQDSLPYVHEALGLTSWANEVEDLHLEGIEWIRRQQLVSFVSRFRNLSRLSLCAQTFIPATFLRMPQPIPLPKLRAVRLQANVERVNQRRGGKLPMHYASPRLLDWIIGHDKILPLDHLELGWQECFSKPGGETTAVLQLVAPSVRTLAILPPILGTKRERSSCKFLQYLSERELTIRLSFLCRRRTQGTSRVSRPRPADLPTGRLGRPFRPPAECHVAGGQGAILLFRRGG